MALERNLVGRPVAVPPDWAELADGAIVLGDDPDGSVDGLADGAAVILTPTEGAALASLENSVGCSVSLIVDMGLRNGLFAGASEAWAMGVSVVADGLFEGNVVGRIVSPVGLSVGLCVSILLGKNVVVSFICLGVSHLKVKPRWLSEQTLYERKKLTIVGDGVLTNEGGDSIALVYVNSKIPTTLLSLHAHTLMSAIPPSTNNVKGNRSSGCRNSASPAGQGCPVEITPVPIAL